MIVSFKTLVLLGIVAVFAPIQAPGQSSIPEDDPIFGEWELDKTRSLFFGREEAPEKQTRIYEPDPAGVKSTIITVSPNGDRNTAQFVSSSDGVPSPFYGAETIDEIALQRRGPYEAFVKLSNGAVEIGSAWRNISLDGKVLTIRMELDGNVASIRVYNKVED